MNTLRLGTDDTSLNTAAELLRAGETVALPTETVYGLGANALRAEAVTKIFAAKERPSWDPLIVHIADVAQVNELVVNVTDEARRLMEAFWPGPLTLLLERSALISDAITAGRPLVGIRMPAHTVAREVIRRAGVPVAAPSANRFGRTSPTSAAHVLEDLDGRIAAVVDAGETEHGVESTVLDTTVAPMVVYRPGAVSLEQLRHVVADVRMFQETAELIDAPREALPSPGVGLRHYAPRARLILLSGPEYVAEARATAGEAERVGVLWPAGLGELGFEAVVYPWGDWADAATLAHSLFAGLRALDAAGCAVILCPVPMDDGIGLALRDRLRKAATR